MKLYRVSTVAITLPNSGLYWQAGEGFLHLWLFALSPVDALTQALGIIKTTCYEPTADQFEIVCRPEHDETMRSQQEHARRHGYAISFYGLPVGETIHP